MDLEMPAELVFGILVSTSRGKGDIRNCSSYRVMKHLEHGMKVVEMV